MGEGGEAATEYLGVLVLVGLVIVALLTSGIATKIAQGVQAAVCRIMSIEDCAGGAEVAGPAGSVAERTRVLENAEAARAGFVAEYGGRLAEMEQQARAARQAGDLDTAERLSAQLDHYRRLEQAGVRGPGLVELAAASDVEFADLVSRGTIDLQNGKFNTRYFQTEPVPGEGVLAYDFFIAADSSGGFLNGDDRDHADPFTVPLERSRVFVLIDRATGRGQILQTETCTVTVLGRSTCNEPRPIALNGEGPIANDSGNDITGEGINVDQTNQFDVTADAGGVSLSYDALNSITPLLISVDGTVVLDRTADGSYEVVTDTRDNYPSRSITYYPIEGEPIVIDQQGEDGVFCGGLPFSPPLVC